MAVALACFCSGACADIVDVPEAAAPQQKKAAESSISVERRAMQLAPGQRVTINNALGDIRVKPAADQVLRYAGTVQRLEGETRDPDFTVDDEAFGLAFGIWAPTDWNGRVDAGFRVPGGAPLVLRATAGLIDVRAGANDIDALSTSGDIALRSEGSMSAKTASGNIRVALHGTDFEGMAGSLESGDGDIEIWVRPDASLSIRIAASRVVNQMPPSSGQVETGEDSLVVLRIGEGAAVLTASSPRGEVSIRAIPLPDIAPPPAAE